MIKPIKILFFILLGTIVAAGCKSSRQIAERKPSQEPVEVTQTEQLESTVLLIDATKQRILGNWANAVLLYAEAVKRDPSNSAAFFELAKIHAQQGHLKDAEMFALQATRLDPGNIYYNLALADIYFLQEKNQAGLDVQRRLAQLYPNNLNLQISLLSSSIYTEEYQEALTVIDHIEMISGFNDELSIQKQKILILLGRVDEAIEEVTRLISYFPEENDYLELMAELYSETGQKEKAYEIYRQMLETTPENPMARLLLADYYTTEGEIEKAFDELIHAFRSTRLDVQSKARIMYTFYQLSEDDDQYLDQAYKLCDILIEVHPDDAQINALYGDFLFRDERYDEAREKFMRASEIEPSEIAFWQQILFIDSREGNYEQLLEVSDKALEYFFEHAIIYLFNGIAHLYLNNYDEAIASFNYGRVLAVNNQDLKEQFLTLLADTYYKNDDPESAFQHYEEALALNPENALALNNYSYYLSLRNENLEKALNMSAKANKLEENNAAYQDTYGWINYKLGDYPEAKIWIEKAIENKEKPSATVLEHYGDVLYKLGEKEKAVYYWEKALGTEKDEFDEVSEFLEKKIRDKTLYE
jgi:tetratricopeptide (TPR) repeat protein